LLASAREHRSGIDESWESAFASARKSISQWSSSLREKVSSAAQELRSEDTLIWNVSPSASHRFGSLHSIPICSVTVVCLFSKEPLALSRSGIRGGIYGHLDLSRAIGEPEVRETGVSEDSEFVTWEELDDGRVGRIELMGRIEHAMPHDKECGTPPVPKTVVRATPIRYDDYHQDFEEKYHREKVYGDPLEAYEVFLALVIENAKVPQYDVRQRSGQVRRQHGTEHARISDRGKFDIGLLEN